MPLAFHVMDVHLYLLPTQVSASKLFLSKWKESSAVVSYSCAIPSAVSRRSALVGRTSSQSSTATHLHTYKTNGGSAQLSPITSVLLVAAGCQSVKFRHAPAARVPSGDVTSSNRAVLAAGAQAKGVAIHRLGSHPRKTQIRIGGWVD